MYVYYNKIFVLLIVIVILIIGALLGWPSLNNTAMYKNSSTIGKVLMIVGFIGFFGFIGTRIRH